MAEPDLREGLGEEGVQGPLILGTPTKTIFSGYTLTLFFLLLKYCSKTGKNFFAHRSEGPPHLFWPRALTILNPGLLRGIPGQHRIPERNPGEISARISETIYAQTSKGTNSGILASISEGIWEGTPEECLLTNARCNPSRKCKKMSVRTTFS